MSATRSYEHRAKLLSCPGRPTLMVAETAQLSCGCSVHIGLLLGDGEPATAAVPCSTAHNQLVHHFNLLLRESLTEPGACPLIDVVEEKLGEAERHWQGAPA